MLTRGDDYPVHQTAEPIAQVATGDRNFYDRYFFNGYSRDGELFFAAALGVYPNRGVMDAAVSVLHDGRHHVVRASRRAPVDRMETEVGPISVDVLEPLQRLRVRVGANEWGLAMDATFRLRGPVLEEPRFQRRAGVRLVMDYTRLTQHGSWEGTISLPGRTFQLVPGAFWGSRDRSWGTRPVGEPEGGARPAVQQYFWLWAPLNFPRTLTHFDVNEEADGARWHETGMVVPADGRRSAIEVAERVAHDLHWRRGTRRIEAGAIELEVGGRPAHIELRPIRHFTMGTIGYLHSTWGHGMDRGELAVDGEIVPAMADDDGTSPHLHVQTICAARLERAGAPAEDGIGVFEQLVIGPHRPYGFTGLTDGAA